MSQKQDVHVGQKINDFWNDLKKKAEQNSKEFEKYKSGIDLWDVGTFNFKKGDLTVLCGPDSEPKMDFVLNLFNRIARKRDYVKEGNQRNTPLEAIKSCVYCLKYDPAELLAKLLCIESDFPRSDLEKGIKNGKSKELESGKKSLQKSCLRFFPLELETFPRDFANTHHEVVAIDVFELLHMDDSDMGRFQALCYLKHLAIESDCHMIVCVDLCDIKIAGSNNRLEEKLWLSGADNVFFIWHDDKKENERLLLQALRCKGKPNPKSTTFSYSSATGRMNLER